jgi:UDP-2,3-diacylglucosamine pyrophosphatase LpxH
VRAIVLSDLHLGATAGTATDDAFVSFLQWLTERAHLDAAPWRLVLLGDLLDLLHAPADARDPLAALDAVATRHRSTLGALGAAAAHGVVVDLVPGNHDSELVEPGLQERLRDLAAAAAGTSAVQLRRTFRVRPWFLLVPGLLYAEHGSQYHALNAVGDPLAPCGRWSPRLPPGAVLDLFGRATHGGRARALPRLVPAALHALARRRRTDAATEASLQACARETGLTTDTVAGLRGLAEDSSVALLRNACAALLGRAGYVESRQQQAAVGVHKILAHEGQAVPVYLFGHTHHVAHRALDADGARLLWFNGGAWADGSYGFVEVDGRADGVVVRLCRWDPVARSALTLSDPFLARPSVAQELAPTTTGRSAGSKQVGRPGGDPVTL